MHAGNWTRSLSVGISVATIAPCIYKLAASGLWFWPIQTNTITLSVLGHIPLAGWRNREYSKFIPSFNLEQIVFQTIPTPRWLRFQNGGRHQSRSGHLVWGGANNLANCLNALLIYLPKMAGETGFEPVHTPVKGVMGWLTVNCLTN